MRRIKLALLSIALATVGLAQAASAADMPVKAPVAKAIWTWTGGYIGLNVGYTWGRNDPAIAGYTEAAFVGFLPATPASFTTSSIIGGAQWGWNYQIGNIVLGAESDLSFLSRSGSSSSSGTATGGIPMTFTVTQKLDWLGTTRARLGFTANERLLVYGTGGIAYGGVTISNLETFTGGTPSSYGGSRKETRVGWAGGAGAEYAFGDKWSGKIEYLYYDLGSGAVVGFPNVANPPFEIHSRATLSGHIVRAGLNYRPDWLAFLDPPLSARASGMYTKAAPATVRDWEFQSGLRFWFSSGRTKKDLFDATGATLVSRLTYTGLDSVSGEAFGRIDHRTGLFVKGYWGAGGLKRGNLQDEDFPPTVTPYSSTNSGQNDGAINYANVDLGYNVVRTPTHKLGLFGGYHYYREQVNAYGCTQVGGAGSTICVPTISSAILVISQDNKWHAARIGLNGEVMVSDRLTLGAEAAWIPYGWMDGADSHWLRIQNGFNGPIPENGQVRGFQAEAILKYAVASNFDVGIGGRYWRFEVPNGLSHFETAAVPPGTAQVEKWVTERYGIFVQGNFKF